MFHKEIINRARTNTLQSQFTFDSIQIAVNYENGNHVLKNSCHIEVFKAALESLVTRSTLKISTFSE